MVRCVVNKGFLGLFVCLCLFVCVSFVFVFVCICLLSGCVFVGVFGVCVFVLFVYVSSRECVCLWMRICRCVLGIFFRVLFVFVCIILRWGLGFFGVYDFVDIMCRFFDDVIR